MRTTKVFTPAWRECYKTAWNRDPELVDSLARIGFDARIGFGYLDAEAPAVVVFISAGRVKDVAPHGGEELDWDLRASAGDWRDWMAMPPGLLALSMAYTEHRLRFHRGSYATVIKNPRLAHPFVRSFGAMSAAARCANRARVAAPATQQDSNS